jgi:hypothetical protein
MEKETDMNVPSRHLRSAMLPVGTIVLLVATTAFNPAPSFADSPKPIRMSKNTAAALAFHDDMRKLWEDHVTWTRLFIVDAAANLASKGPTTERLLKNQDDIGDTVKPYYGEAAGTQLEKLLSEHIKIATELVSEAKKGDQIKAGDAKQRWFANADEIASFLSGANPKNWPGAEMKKMMHDHLNLTNEEATAHLSADWATSILAYDKVHEQNMLSAGIVNQFPAKF